MQPDRALGIVSRGHCSWLPEIVVYQGQGPGSLPATALHHAAKRQNGLPTRHPSPTASPSVLSAGSPDVKPLIASPREAEAAWYQKTGLYPINHTGMAKDAWLQAAPTLAARLVRRRHRFMGKLPTAGESHDRDY
jgi:hypothetical protein